jgi:DNA-binding NtrC family response regulator
MPEPSILLVDDDVDICSNLADILTDLDYRVDVAHDGTAALSMLNCRRYDVVVVDYKMPGMNGVTLLRKIRQVRPDAVSLMVTAYAGSAAEDAIDAGACQILSKPVDVGSLLSLVNDAVGRPLILVVDDDRDLCSNLWDLLHERGYRVGLAYDAEGASQRLTETPFQVVLLDVKLPDGDASEVFHKIRDSNPEAHTVLITGESSATGDLIEQILSEGADAVHYKPFNVPSLLEALGRLIKNHPKRRDE